MNNSRTKSRDLREQILRNNKGHTSFLGRNKSLDNSLDESMLRNSDLDERERNKHRKSMSNVQIIQNSPDGGSGRLSIQLNESEMKNHINVCNRLYAENKISSKNVWKLHIIDVLKALSKTENGPKVMQEAATSLEISGKVYGIRVDHIHSEGLKLANLMAKTTEETVGHDNPVDSDNEVDITVKRGRRKCKGFRTNGMIAKDKNSLLGKLTKLESVMFSVREHAGCNSHENLFTVVLPINSSGSSFFIGPESSYFETNSDDLVLSISNDKHKLEMLPQPNYYVCPSISEFALDVCDLEDSCERKAEPIILYDESGVPIPELDGSIHEFLSGEEDVENNGTDSCTRGEGPVKMLHDGFEFENITTITSDHGSMSFQNESICTDGIMLANGRVIEKLWAGPSHWKVKHIRPLKERFSGASVESLPKRRRLAGSFVTELDPFDILMSQHDTVDVNDKLPKKKATVTNYDSITLPLISMYSFDYDFLLKPGCRPTPYSESSNFTSTLKTSEDVNNNCSTYDYGNPNDSQYCALQMDVDDEDDIDDDKLHNESAFPRTPKHLVDTFAGEELIDAPDHVEQLRVHFNAKSKKINMKRLKNCVWSLIQSSSNSSQLKEKGGLRLSDIWAQLPSTLSSEEAAELSPALSFATLLHLAHENNLILSPVNDIFSDIAINLNK